MNMSVQSEELLVPAHLNFGKFLLDRLRKILNPERTCLHNCSTGDKLSYSEFVQCAVSLSVTLTQAGVRRGDTVVVGGEARATFLPAGLAVVLAGAAYTPIELHCGRAVLIHKLNLTRPKYVICSRSFWEAYGDILKGLDFIKTFISFEPVDGIELCVEAMTSRHVDVESFEPATVDGASDVAMIVYSSGTTGMSKGVLLTHLNCIGRCDSLGFYGFSSLQTACFLSNDFSGTYSTFTTYLFLCAGKKFLYTDNKNIDLKVLQDNQVNALLTYFSPVEELVSDEIMGEYDLSSLKIIYSGGGPLHLAVKQEYKRRYPNVHVLAMYGTTEAGLITTLGPSGEDSTTVGVAAPFVKIKVVDTETREILGPNQRGELCVRSPCMMKGYLGATAPYFDGQGYCLTGDLGYYDDQKKFYVIDRLTDVISYMAAKVCPGEVEAVLLQHPAVREAAVVGAPAGAAGEQAAAFVVLRPGGAQVTEADLQDFVAQQLSGMQLTGGVRFLAELPKNYHGKILRRRLKEMFVEGDMIELQDK